MRHVHWQEVRAQPGVSQSPLTNSVKVLTLMEPDARCTSYRLGRRWRCMRTFHLLIAIALVLLLAAGPAAQAQSNVQRLDLSLQGFTDDPQLQNNRILPETDVAKVRVDAFLNVNMFNRGSTCSTPVQVEFLVSGPSYATAVMVPATRTLVIPGQSGSGSQASWQSFPVNANLEITVGRDAPAFADGLYEVTMKATGQQAGQGGSTCDLGTSAPSVGTYRLKNDFTPRTSIDAGKLFAEAGPNEKVVFPIELTNIGNGPSRVAIQLQPSESEAFRAFNAGPEVRLAAGSAGVAGMARTVLVEVTPPATWGYTNQISNLVATITTTYDGVAPGTTFQETSSFTFTVQTQGVYVSPLGLPTFLGVPLVLGLAALAGIYGAKGVTRYRARRGERKSKASAEEAAADETDDEASKASDQSSMVKVLCPQCGKPAHVRKGTRPESCAHCGFR